VNSSGSIRSTIREPRFARERTVQGLALAALLLMGGFVIAGPSGVIAWTENEHLLAQHQQRIQHLASERDRLQNRVQLLDPRHADPDLAGELLRRNLNVAHPDEMVMLLDGGQPGPGQPR